MKLIKKLPKNIPSDVCWVSDDRMWHSSAELLRSTRWNANLILTCDVAELVYVCEVIFWKTRILVRTAKWPPRIIFAGNCGQTQSVLPENHGQTMLKMSRYRIMVWPWFSWGTVGVCPQFPYHGNEPIFWLFPIVPCHAFCMWHWPIDKDLDLSFIWGHHHLHTVGLWISADQLNTSQLWRDPTRSKQLSTVAIWLSVWTCRCPVKLST